MARRLAGHGVELRAAENALPFLSEAEAGGARVVPAGPDDFDTEWMALILGVKLVGGLDEAIDHIQAHSTEHTDVILTNDLGHATRFVNEVTSSAVFVNASTRFNDGGQFGPVSYTHLDVYKRQRLGHPDLPPTLANKQMLAAVGQTRLMQMWEHFFGIYGLFVGQLLLTRADVENRRRFLNARDALHTLLAHRVVPVINENDAVATEEIRLGDNDTLSALVAILAEADLLLLLTDQPGLFTADPQTDPAATLIPEAVSYTHLDVYKRQA